MSSLGRYLRIETCEIVNGDLQIKFKSNVKSAPLEDIEDLQNCERRPSL